MTRGAAALSPVQIEVERYGRLDPEEQEALRASVQPSATNAPIPGPWAAARQANVQASATDRPYNRDYVVTVRTPLISRFRIGQDPSSMTLAVQELTQTTSTTPTRFGDHHTSSYITQVPDPFVIGRRQLLPQESAVRFLARPRGAEERAAFGNVSVSSSARLRVALQASIEWELGEMVLPTPALTHYEPYQEGEHDQPPARRHRTVNNPVTGMLRQLTGQPQNPRYWHVQEFDV